MEIDHTEPRSGRHAVPDTALDPAPGLPAQRVESPSGPIPVRTGPAQVSTGPIPVTSGPIPVTPGPAGPVRVRPAPPAPVARRRPPWTVFVILLAILLVGAGLGTWLLLPGSIDTAEVGDCASYDRSNTADPYATVRCGSSAAAFTVLQVIDGEGSCREVAGATRSTISTEGGNRHEVCLGPKDLDPAAAVNVAQVGDCLTGTSGQERRVPCTDPSATLKILKRVNNMAATQVSTACDNVPNAVSVYSWTWDADDGTGPAVASYQTDAVFCLGSIR